jgi:hypothetical protein
VFQNLKISGRQGKEKPRFVIYKIGKDVDTKEDKIVVETVVTEKEIEEKGKSQSSYEFFISHLPRDEPRWAVYDFEFEKEGAGKRNKLVFYHWYAFLYALFSVEICILTVCFGSGLPRVKASLFLNGGFQ